MPCDLSFCSRSYPPHSRSFPYRPPSNRQPLSPSRPQFSDSYVGQYRQHDEPDIVLSVFRDHDRLYFEGARTPRTDLHAKSATVFTPDNGSTFITFITDSNGAVTAAEVSGPPPQTFDKISSQPVPNHFRPYSRQEVMIPMRDGVKLHAIILRPKDTKDPLPFLMQRTPYGVDDSSSDSINGRIHRACPRAATSS